MSSRIADPAFGPAWLNRFFARTPTPPVANAAGLAPTPLSEIFGVKIFAGQPLAGHHTTNGVLGALATADQFSMDSYLTA